MNPPFRIFETEARTILSRTSGFIAEAGFSHSLTPFRNCTFGCTYCYVPTMRFQGGLKSDDWNHWGQFTTAKRNAATLLRRTVRGSEVVYCSPLTDPYQPAEAEARLMPGILDSLIDSPPRVFTFQTRGPLITRDLPLLQQLATRTSLRVSFSLTTNRDQVRRWYEPHCAPLSERLAAIDTLRAAGIRVFATLAPILPCDPEELAQAALEHTTERIVGDPFHTRAAKPNGATTRPQAVAVSRARGFEAWHDPASQSAIIERIGVIIARAGRQFGVGPKGFSWLAQ